MARKIGAITVGQSPRSDVVPEMVGLLGAVELEQRGALDGLTTDEIAAISPEPGDYVLVTRLRDGSSVRIAEKHILQRMQIHMDDLLSKGAEGILLLCTGEFPSFQCSKPILYPQRLLQHFTAGTVGDRNVGILTPDISQVLQARRRWQENGVKEVIVEPASPYGNPADVIKAAQKLKEQGAQAVVMDCIGYTCTMKQEIVKLTGLPTILPRTVAARAVAELFG